MGQQQLLLLVLGIVIVGLAVVVGINAFSENRIKSNADAMVTDGLRIASDIQAWALKPEQFGGGNDGDAATDDLDTFAALTDPLSEIGYQTTSGAYANVNGSYAISTTAGTGCTLSVTPNAVLNVTNADTGNTVCIGISGTSANDIETDVVYGSGSGS